LCVDSPKVPKSVSPTANPNPNPNPNPMRLSDYGTFGRSNSQRITVVFLA